MILSHNWQRIPGQTTVWRCTTCGAYAKGVWQSLPALGCPGTKQRKKEDQTPNKNRLRFQELVRQLGHTAVVYRIRRYILQAWDFEEAANGLRVLDPDYQEIVTVPWDALDPLLEDVGG